MFAQKTRKLSQRVNSIGKGGDNHHLAQLQSHCSRLEAEVGEVVFVAFADLLDHTMHTQTFPEGHRDDVRRRVT
jgi:hypothetical protein